MSHQFERMNEEQLLQKLRDILLKKDRAELQQLREVLEDRQKLSQRVAPIIEEHIDFIKQNFPQEFTAAVEKIVDSKLEGSQERILNVIYPVLGKMIRKFITHQFQMLKDNIDARVRTVFSRQGMWGRIKSKLFGVEASDIILSDIDHPVIEEIFLIQKHSGLLMGKASKQATIDQDVIAGMFTAIKSFVEDAFKQKTEDLEMIEYDNYKILLQNFHTYYFAIVLSGSLSLSERTALSEELLDFALAQLSDHQELEESNFDYISAKLKERFFPKAAAVVN